VLAAHPTRRGTRALAALLADWSQGLITRSDLERDMYALCEAHDLPRPSVNSPVGPYEADFAWRAQRLIVEVDTYRYHGTRPAFERDRARDAGLTAAGWRVVRFTDRQIHGDPAAVGAVLARLVSARRA
jgi:very-short-patch-repair endonuclease